jgi:hypothetical protein
MAFTLETLDIRQVLPNMHQAGANCGPAHQGGSLQIFMQEPLAEGSTRAVDRLSYCFG